MVPRIGTDVVDAHPTLVVWQVGTNEALRGTVPATFARLLDEGLRQLTSIGADVVLMDYQLAPRMPAEAITGVYGEIIAKEAKAHEVPLFSRAALMRSWQASDTRGQRYDRPGRIASYRSWVCLCRGGARQRDRGGVGADGRGGCSGQEVTCDAADDRGRRSECGMTYDARPDD